MVRGSRVGRGEHGAPLHVIKVKGELKNIRWCACKVDGRACLLGKQCANGFRSVRALRVSGGVVRGSNTTRCLYSSSIEEMNLVNRCMYWSGLTVEMPAFACCSQTWVGQRSSTSAAVRNSEGNLLRTSVTCTPSLLANTPD